MNRIFDKTKVRQGAGGKVSALTLGLCLAALTISGILSVIVITVL